MPYFPPCPPPPQTPCGPGDVEVRLYNGAGLRQRFPREWWSTLEFEVTERGGYANGSIQIIVPWDQLQLVGNERLDVCMWGQRVYRGYIRIPQSELSTPQRSSPSLFGLMEILNGYIVRRGFCYSAMVDVSQLFTDLVFAYVNVAGRQLGITVDATGVPSLGLTIQTFDATGKTFPQAMNQLCDYSPHQLIWGCDVDATGNNRIYLKPRQSTATYSLKRYVYAVGGGIRHFVYPRDETRIVNSLFVTGAKADPANLCPNASFEKCVPPGELTSNLLQNPSFETAPGVNNFPPWTRSNDPTIGNGARTGSNAVVMDNNPNAPEIVLQQVQIGYAQQMSAACWVQSYVQTGTPAQLAIGINLQNNTGATLYNAESPAFDLPPDGAYRHYAFTWPLPVPNDPAVTQAQVYYKCLASNYSYGWSLDDCSLWGTVVLADSWILGTPSSAYVQAIDWGNMDTAYPPADGELKLKVTPVITGAGGYVEVRTSPQARISVKPQRTYYLGCYVQAPAGQTVNVAVGGTVYNGSTVVNTLVGTQRTISSGGWTLVLYQITMAASGNDGLEMFIRFYGPTGVAAYVDACGVFEGQWPNLYYPGGSIAARRSVLDYATSLSSAAANSITTYGTREKTESNDLITDTATLDAFCIGYFNTNAVPKVQAELEIFSATAPLFLDGMVQVVNVPSEPPSLFPSRVRYNVGETINITAELGDELPDLAQLLRLAQEKKLF